MSRGQGILPNNRITTATVLLLALAAPFLLWLDRAELLTVGLEGKIALSAEFIFVGLLLGVDRLIAWFRCR